MSADREKGFIAIEWVAAVALLLLPAVALVATLPTWIERRHAATVAAREAARELEQSWPAGAAGAAEFVGRYVATDHGVAASDVEVRVLSVGAAPGDQIRVEVRVRMPVLAIPGVSAVGGWTYSAVVNLRVGDYRSR